MANQAVFDARDIGMTVTQGAQEWTLDRVERGQRGVRLIWTSRCPLCGSAFETRSLQIFRRLTRRCPRCIREKR